MFRRHHALRRTLTQSGTLLRLIAQDEAGNPLAEAWVRLPFSGLNATQQAVDLSALMNHPANWEPENWPGAAPDAPGAFVSMYAAHLEQQGAQVQPSPADPDTPCLTVRAHLPSALLATLEEAVDQDQEATAHTCSLSLGAVALQVAGHHCVISGIHSRDLTRLEAYLPCIGDVLTHGPNTSLILKERDTRDGTEDAYVAARVNLPSCPHERLGVCEHLSHSYFDEPHYHAADHTHSRHWMTVEALAVLNLGPAHYTHLHVFEVNAPLLSSLEEADPPVPMLN